MEMSPCPTKSTKGPSHSPKSRSDKSAPWARRHRRGISKSGTTMRPATISRSIRRSTRCCQKKARSAKPISIKSTTTYIAASQLGERIDSVNSRVLDEIKQVITMINAAAGSATSYSEAAESGEPRARTGQGRRSAARRHRVSGPGRQGNGAQQQEAGGAVSPRRARKSSSSSKISKPCATKA